VVYVDGRDDVVLHEYEITGSAQNRALFVATAERLDFEVTAVPVTVVANEYVFVGFSDYMAVEIDYAVTQLLEAAEVDPGQIDPGSTTDVDVPLFGRIDLGDHSLVLATLLIGFLDGVNPCSRCSCPHDGCVRLVHARCLQHPAVIAHVGWIRVGVALIAGITGVVNLLDAFDVDPAHVEQPARGARR